MASSAPKRVLITADTVGGVWTYAMELARGLASRGIEVALATMGAPGSEDQRKEMELAGDLRLYESAFKLEWMSNPWEDVSRAGHWLLEIEEDFRPDIVHLNQYSFGALPFRAPALVVGHSCVCSWWHEVRRGDAPREWDRYRESVARGLHAASLVVAPTRAMLASLDEHYGPLPSGSTVIPNGRETLLAQSRRLVVSKQPFLLAAGRLWDEAKNLAAVEAVAPELPWPVYVAGDTRHPDGGRRALKACRFLGKLTPAEMAGWMDRASIFLAPARYEPFGLSVLEAALAGCALVLGDIPSLRENWADHALFVSPDDPAALRQATCSLIEDPQSRLRLSQRARRRALEFNATRMVSRYTNVYAAMLNCVRRLTSCAVARIS